MSKAMITEAELHAYADAQLDGARRADIDAYLGSNPEEAVRLGAYQEQKRALRECFNSVLHEPIPEALRQLALPPARVAEPTGRWPRWSLQRFAAGIAIALVSGAAGWLGHGQYPTAEQVAQLTQLPRQAAVAHAVFSPDVRRPVEISSEHEEQLVTWLSKRMGTPVRPPKLGTLGYELIGGRLLPGNTGPVAQFMYHDASGQRLTLYVSTEAVNNEHTAFRFAQEGSVNVFYWIDGKFGYALSASIDKGELARVAKVVYDQLDRK